ncbi:MAG: FtsQ-type POTRA domain-containing protein [Deltaproteobacteria bacterium]|nr:FtsQ-type POTRA domain-containing protein [Deltaproteobacteria bacterium]
MMERRSLLKKQYIERKKPKAGKSNWTGIKKAGSLSFKCLLLMSGVLVISYVFLSMYQYLLTSPYMKLEEVVIADVDEDTKNILMDLADLNSDMSLLAINIIELKDKLESHPWIRSVDIEKHFPHRLIIRAEKEVPRAIVAFEKLAYVNRWGMVFSETVQTDDMDYPVITGVDKNKDDMDERLRIAVSILNVLEAEPEPWSIKELSEIHLEKDGDVSLYPVSIPIAVNIRGSELAGKKAKLKKIINHLTSKGLIHTVKRIDMNYDNSAVVSFRKG